MNKAELVEAIAQDMDGVTKKKVGEILDKAIAVIQYEVARQEKVVIVGFGSFESRHRAGRVGRNPKTGEELTIPACNVPYFSPGKNFKELVDS